MLAYKINPPVVAFFLVVLAGWGYALLSGDWLSVALALVLAIVAGDLVAAIFGKKDGENPKGSGKNKK